MAGDCLRKDFQIYPTQASSIHNLSPSTPSSSPSIRTRALQYCFERKLCLDPLKETNDEDDDRIKPDREGTPRAGCAPAMAGRLSTRQSREISPSRTSRRMSNPDIFSDEFALEPLSDYGSSPVSPIAVADSHVTEGPITSMLQSSRSSDIAHGSTSPPPTGIKPSQYHAQTGTSHPPQVDLSSPPHRTSSMMTASTASNAQSSVNRSLSTSSRVSVPPRALSPYVGQTGPSHPYGMYPQGVSRTLSVATSSTVRFPERAFVGSNGPEHPYAMYPQNTVEDEESAGFDPTSIPVGFPGHHQNYQRRLGPDGEEAADIIGPDGHTEQLPPYTRYPDAGEPKTDLGPPGFFGASRNPDSPIDSPMSPQSHMSSRTMASDGAIQLNTAAAGAAGCDSSGSFKERFREKSRRRLWFGVPLWVFCMIGLIVFGAIIGGIIGGIVGRKKATATGVAQPDSAPLPPSAEPSTVFATVTATTFIDATPLPTSFGTPQDLPIGIFNIPANSLITSSSSCVADQRYGATWGCENSGSLGAGIQKVSTGGAKIQFLPVPGNGSLHYGAQPPNLTNPYMLTMMLDKDAVTMGPALFFWDYYDKVVVVPSSMFPIPSSKRSVRESELTSRDQDFYRKGIASAGDKPWFCYWNSTVFEFFLYINQNTTAAQQGNNLSGASAWPTSTADGYPSRAASSVLPVNAASTTTAAGYRSVKPRDYIDWPPAYPRVIKMEEKRKSQNNVQPYCQQMQILDDGSIGGPISPENITIDEHEPPPGGRPPPSGQRRDVVWIEEHVGEVEKRRGLGSNCACEWLSR